MIAVYRRRYGATTHERLRDRLGDRGAAGSEGQGRCLDPDGSRASGCPPAPVDRRGQAGAARARGGARVPARLGEQSLASGDSACRGTYHRSARRRCSHQEDAGRGRLLQRQSKAGQACTGRAFRCCRKPTWLDLAGRCASASAADRVERRRPGARHGHARVAGRQPRTLLAEGEAGREACHGERSECSRTRARSRLIWRQVASADMVYEPRPNGLILFRRRVPILTVGSHLQPQQQGSHGGIGRAAREAMAKASDNGPLSLPQSTARRLSRPAMNPSGARGVRPSLAAAPATDDARQITRWSATSPPQRPAARPVLGEKGGGGAVRPAGRVGQSLLEPVGLSLSSLPGGAGGTHPTPADPRARPAGDLHQGAHRDRRLRPALRLIRRSPAADGEGTHGQTDMQLIAEAYDLLRRHRNACGDRTVPGPCAHGPLPGNPPAAGEFVMLARRYGDHPGWWISPRRFRRVPPARHRAPSLSWAAGRTSQHEIPPRA